MYFSPLLGSISYDGTDVSPKRQIPEMLSNYFFRNFFKSPFIL